MPSALVVDENVVVRNFLRSALEHAGFLVADARNDDEALAVCRGLKAYRVDLLIVDHLVPAHKGRALAERILRYYPRAKVLMISGYPAEVVQAERGLFPGAAFLAKPFSVQQLNDVVFNVFSFPVQRAQSSS